MLLAEHDEVVDSPFFFLQHEMFPVDRITQLIYLVVAEEHARDWRVVGSHVLEVLEYLAERLPLHSYCEVQVQELLVQVHVVNDAVHLEFTEGLFLLKFPGPDLLGVAQQNKVSMKLITDVSFVELGLVVELKRIPDTEVELLEQAPTGSVPQDIQMLLI